MPRKPDTIVQAHKANFETLKEVFARDQAALVECELKDTNEKVAVICSMHRDSDGQYNMTPFAMFFNGNPYEMLRSPVEIDERGKQDKPKAR